MLSQIHYLARKYECDIRLMNTPDLEVSSSDIRKESKKDFQSANLYQRQLKSILQKNIYLRKNKMKQLTIRKIKEEVKMHLDQNRYEHTLGVMYTAGALAMRYGADLEDTMIAGLLHDCAKCIPSAQK